MMGRVAGRRSIAPGRSKVALLAALAASVLAPGPSAYAQFNPFRQYRGPLLTREDLDAGAAAARTLLDSEPAAVGQTASWTGPTTGNTGTFTIRRVFHRSNMPCRIMTSDIAYRQPQRTREYTLRVCRIANGQWKLAD